MVFENCMQFSFFFKWCFLVFCLGFLVSCFFNLFIMFVNNLDSESIAESRVLSREHTHISAVVGSAKGIVTIGNEYSKAQ